VWIFLRSPGAAWASAFGPGQRRSVEEEASVAFGSGLGNVDGVRLRPRQLRQRSAWAWVESAAFGLGGGNVRIWAAIHRC
jgi:hypothetical protein